MQIQIFVTLRRILKEKMSIHYLTANKFNCPISILRCKVPDTSSVKTFLDTIFGMFSLKRACLMKPLFRHLSHCVLHVYWSVAKRRSQYIFDCVRPPTHPHYATRKTKLKYHKSYTENKLKYEFNDFKHHRRVPSCNSDRLWSCFKRKQFESLSYRVRKSLSGDILMVVSAPQHTSETRLKTPLQQIQSVTVKLLFIKQNFPRKTTFF